MVGDPVVAIIAETSQQALDATELVLVDYEPLPVANDPEEAIEAPPIHPDMEGNVAYERKGGDPSAVDALAAATVIEGTIEHPRVVPSPIETRVVVAEWRDDALTVHLGSQAPHLMAEELAKAFGLATVVGAGGYALRRRRLRMQVRPGRGGDAGGDRRQALPETGALG